MRRGRKGLSERGRGEKTSHSHGEVTEVNSVCVGMCLIDTHCTAERH